MRKFAFLLLWTLFPCGIEAQERKKIAITLGGGGALGLAHIGILEWLEENHIPVDYVTGTSMGALIGGVYASGLPAKEVHEVVTHIDWNRVFQNGPDFENLIFRRKEDRRAFPNALEFGLRKGVSTPSGLISGQGLALLLNNLFLNYPADRTFDQLPIPFRCIATDLVTGERVELSSGPLAQALRASSAIPGVFVPVWNNGQVLVDGGITDNLPVESAKAMGADIVIASVLPIPDLADQDIQGLSAVAARVVSVSVVQNERRSAKLATLLLEPAVAAFQASDYSRYAELIRKGHEAAEKHSAELKKYALSEKGWKAHLANRQSRRRSEPKPAFVEVSGGSNAARERLQQQLSRDLPLGVGQKSMEAAIAREFGTMRYNWIDYSMQQRDGKEGIGVRLTEKKHAPPFLFVATEVSGEDAGRASLTVSTRAVFTEFTHRDAELRADLSVGSRTLIGAEYYRRLGDHGWFVAPHASFSRAQTNLYALNRRVGEADLDRSTLGADVGFTSWRWFEVRTGFDYGHIRAATRVGPPIPDGNNGEVVAATARMTYDHQDNAQVPSKGLRLQTMGSYYVHAPLQSGFPLARLEGSYFLPAGEQGRMFVMFGGSSSFGTPLAIPLQLTLGGPLRLGAFSIDQFRGDRTAHATAGYLHRIGKLPPILGGALYLGGWYENGAYQKGTQGGWIQSATTAFVAETPLGPVYAGWSLGRADTQWRGKFSFLVGRFF